MTDRSLLRSLSAAMGFGLPSYVSLSYTAGQQWLGEQLCQQCCSRASSWESDQTAWGETSSAAPRQAMLPHDSQPLVTLTQHQHRLSEQQCASTGTSCLLTFTAVLIKASVSFCLSDLLVLPCHPAFDNYTYCFHESFGLGKNKVGSLGANGDLSRS